MLSNTSVSIDSQNRAPNSSHIFVGLIISLATLFACSELIRTLNVSAFISICFFNFIFVFLLFPLDGPISSKIMLLLAGNVVGIVWHFFIIFFENVFLSLSIGGLKIVFLIFSPLSNFMWIVSLWSISLSVLAKNKLRKNRF